MPTPPPRQLYSCSGKTQRPFLVDTFRNATILHCHEQSTLSTADTSKMLFLPTCSSPSPAVTGGGVVAERSGWSFAIKPVLMWLRPPRQQLSVHKSSTSLRSEPCPPICDSYSHQPEWHSLAAARLWTRCKFEIQIKIKLLRSKQKFTLSYKDNNWISM